MRAYSTETQGKCKGLAQNLEGKRDSCCGEEDVGGKERSAQCVATSNTCDQTIPRSRRSWARYWSNHRAVSGLSGFFFDGSLVLTFLPFHIWAQSAEDQNWPIEDSPCGARCASRRSQPEDRDCSTWHQITDLPLPRLFECLFCCRTRGSIITLCLRVLVRVRVDV